MHPLAWWAWALGLAVAVARSVDVLVVALVLATTVLVALVRRGDTPWGRAFTGYLVLAGAVVLLRLAFHVVVGIKTPGTVVLDLPRVTTPTWAVGVHLLGPVTLEGLAQAAAGGLRLAALVVCFGAANALANPRRALRSLPPALHHLGTAVVIAVSVTPQLATAVGEVRRARRLRGEAPRGLRAVPSLVVPVLTDGLDRSLALAASMDSRGYARAVPGASERHVAVLLLGSLVAAVLGTYGLLAGTGPAWSGAPLLLAGGAAAAGATVLAGRRVRRTRYRPDPWGPPETALAVGGAFAAATAVVAGGRSGPSGLDPVLPVLAVGGVLVAALAGLLAVREAVR